MTCQLDNALSPIVAARLVAGGHDVVRVRDLDLASATDDAIMEAATADSRVLASPTGTAQL